MVCSAVHVNVYMLGVAAFIALFDNYTQELGEQEVVTREEFKENVQ